MINRLERFPQIILHKVRIINLILCLPYGFMLKLVANGILFHADQNMKKIINEEKNVKNGNAMPAK